MEWPKLWVSIPTLSELITLFWVFAILNYWYNELIKYTCSDSITWLNSDLFVALEKKDKTGYISVKFSCNR